MHGLLLDPPPPYAGPRALQVKPIPSPGANPLPGNPTRPKKSLGQHFLVEGRFLKRIIGAAEVVSGDLVIEVGPGRGTLTGALARGGAQVVAVELDESLASTLVGKFEGHPGVRIVTGDARYVDIDSLVPPEAAYKVVANLPYYAASPIVRRFLESEHRPRVMVVMVQREVARNMAAPPGKMGLLSVAVQLYGEPRIVAYVPPRAFRPVPKVASAIVRIDVHPGPVVAFDSLDRFFSLVRAGFSAPRKQIRNSLSNGLDVSTASVDDLLSRAGVDPKRRPQTVSLHEWGALYEVYRSALPNRSSPAGGGDKDAR